MFALTMGYQKSSIERELQMRRARLAEYEKLRKQQPQHPNHVLQVQKTHSDSSVLQHCQTSDNSVIQDKMVQKSLENSSKIEMSLLEVGDITRVTGKLRAGIAVITPTKSTQKSVENTNTNLLEGSKRRGKGKVQTGVAVVKSANYMRRTNPNHPIADDD